MSVLQGRCMSCDVQSHLQQAKAKHQTATVKFDTATSSIYDLLDEEPVELSSVVATLMELQEAGSLQHDCSAFLVGALEATVSSLCTMEEGVAALSADAADAKFLATYRHTETLSKGGSQEGLKFLIWIGQPWQASWTWNKRTQMKKTQTRHPAQKT